MPGYAARRRGSEADLVVLELVRLACAEPWDLATAAVKLRARRHTAGALWRARARVLRAQADAPSRVGQRAEELLETVLGGTAVGRMRSA